MKAFSPRPHGFSFKMKKYIHQYGELSTIHGVYYLTEKRSRSEKFYWITVLSLCLIGCVFMILQIWKKYEDSPIVVTFASREKSLDEVPFPAVTICPESKCSVAEFNYTRVLYDYLDNNTLSDNDLKILNYVNLLCEMGENVTDFNADNRFIGEDFFYIIDKVKADFYKECYFLDRDCEDYFLKVLTDQGICYSFNGVDSREIYRDKVMQLTHFSKINFKFKNFDIETGYTQDGGNDTYPLRVSMSGAENALELYLEYNVSDLDNQCNLYQQGYRIWIDSPLNIPRLSKHYFRVPFNKAVMIAVQPSLVLTTKELWKYDPKKRRCYMKTERPLKYFRMYSQSNCLLECLTNFTLKMCGCVDFYMPREIGTKICGRPKHNCSRDYRKFEFRSTQKLGLNQKACDCKPSCSVLRYDIETSQGDYFWQG